MRVYRNFSEAVPKSASDIACFLLCFTFIPITFVFELAHVLPAFHDTQGMYYSTICILSVFYMFNLIGNLVLCMVVDTSTKGVFLQPPKDSTSRRLWRYCLECEGVMPPRSWHCKICKICILKRDHHCLFTGCCIGHKNYRYFLFFMFYIAIGSIFCTIYNSIYIWWLHAETFRNASTIMKIFLPMLMFAIDISWNSFYLLIYDLNVIAACYSTVLVIYHLPGVFVGAVSNESRSEKYNLGRRKNIEMVLGKRMHLVWLSPFIKSELPNDGINWESALQANSKNL